MGIVSILNKFTDHSYGTFLFFIILSFSLLSSK